MNFWVVEPIVEAVPFVWTKRYTIRSTLNELNRTFLTQINKTLCRLTISLLLDDGGGGGGTPPTAPLCTNITVQIIFLQLQVLKLMLVHLVYSAATVQNNYWL